MVPPAALVSVAFAVERRDGFGGEEASEYVTDEAAHAVDGEDVETLVYTKKVLVFYGEEGGAGCECAD